MTSSPTTITIDSQAAIGFLIACGGNAKLAAVHASKASGDPTGSSITEAALLMAIAQDPGAISYLASQARVLSLVQMLDAFRLTHQAFVQKIDKLAPDALARTYTALLKSVAEASNSVAPASNENALETVLKALPPRVADAVRYFMENPGSAEELPSPPDAAPLEPNAPQQSAPQQSAPAAEPGVTTTPEQQRRIDEVRAQLERELAA